MKTSFFACFYAYRYASSTPTDTLESLIKKEMDLYGCGEQRGQFLQFAYNSLLTLVPTSVESERVFSAAGYKPFVGQHRQ